jgi:hypothetical protein
MTLRHPLEGLPGAIRSRLNEHMTHVSCCNAVGELMWHKQGLDIDSLRSDSPGLMWQIQGNGTEYFLTLGASPASLEWGLNVFGSGDQKHCAEIVVSHARKALGAILPAAGHWELCREDITQNYALPGPSEVKAALRMMMQTEGGRRKPCAMGGDTVGYNTGSDLRKGKAYHKGPQLAYLKKRGAVDVEDWEIALADNLLRLELTLGARFWRRRREAKEKHWSSITESELDAMHLEYFGRFFGAVEVADMGILLERLEKVAGSPGKALSAHRTWALVKAVGYDNARESMPRTTWFRHLKALRDAGVSDADLCAGQIVPFRRHVVLLAEPVRCWEDVRRAA